MRAGCARNGVLVVRASHTIGVIARLVRNCALERAMQYSRGGDEYGEATAYWMPRFRAGHDSGVR